MTAQRFPAKKEVWGRREMTAQRLPSKKEIRGRREITAQRLPVKKECGEASEKVVRTPEKTRNRRRTTKHRHPLNQKTRQSRQIKEKQSEGNAPLIVLFIGENCLFCRRGVGESGSDGGVAFFGERLFVACRQRTTALAPETD